MRDLQKNRFASICLALSLLGTSLLVFPIGPAAADDIDPADPFGFGSDFSDPDDWFYDYGTPPESYPIPGGCDQFGEVCGSIADYGPTNAIGVYKMGDTGRANLWITVWILIQWPPQGQAAGEGNILFYYSTATGDGYFFKFGPGNAGFYKMTNHNRNGVPLSAGPFGVFNIGMWYKIDLVVTNRDFYSYVGLQTQAGLQPSNIFRYSLDQDPDSLVTGSFSYEPWYSSFPAQNNVGLFSTAGGVSFASFHVSADTLYDKFTNGALGGPHWRPVDDNANIQTNNGWAELGGAGASATRIYMPPPPSGQSEFIIDWDFKYTAGNGNSCSCDMMHLYFGADTPKPNPPGPPPVNQDLRFPLESSLNQHVHVRNSAGTEYGQTSPNRESMVMGPGINAVASEGYIIANEVYHVRVAVTQQTLRVYLQDQLVVTHSVDVASWQQYLAGNGGNGWQLSGADVQWGHLFVDNIVLSMTSFYDRLQTLNNWNTYTDNPQVPFPAPGGGSSFNFGNTPGGGGVVHAMFMRPTTMSAESFEISAAAGFVPGTGNDGMFFVFRKSPLGTATWPWTLTCIQFVLSETSPSRFQFCANNMYDFGTDIGSNIGVPAAAGGVLPGGAHLVAIKVAGKHLSAYVDRQFVAEATVENLYAGAFGVFNDRNSGVAVSWLRTRVDNDGDGLVDSEERGTGIQTQTGLVVLGPLGGPNTPMDFEFPLRGAAIAYQPLVRIRFDPWPGGAQATFELQDSNGVTLSQTVVNAASWMDYLWKIVPIGGPIIPGAGVTIAHYKLKITATTFVYLDWFALKAKNMPVAGATTADINSHVQDATDYTNDGANGAGVWARWDAPFYAHSVHYFTEWEYADFDVDQMGDSREYKPLFRTSVPFGAQRGKYYDPANGQLGLGSWIDYRGYHYEYASSGTPAAPNNEPLGYPILHLEDQTIMSLDPDPSGTPPSETLRVWPDGSCPIGCFVARFVRSGANPFGLWGAVDSLTMELHYLMQTGDRAMSMGDEPETTNLRFALMVGVSDDKETISVQGNNYDEPRHAWNFAELRDSLLTQGYIDNGVGLGFQAPPCNGPAFDNSWNPVYDRILVANGDPNLVYPCVNDMLGNAANVDGAFAALHDVMDNNDHLLVYVLRDRQWYSSCYDQGYEGSGPNKHLVIPWSRPTGACSGVTWDFADADTFEGASGTFLGRITKFASLITIYAVAAGDQWIEKDAAHRSVTGLDGKRASIALTDDKDAPDELDQKTTTGAALDGTGGTADEEWGGGQTFLPKLKFEFTNYFSCAIGGRTCGANDVIGNDHYVNSKKSSHSWMDADEGGDTSWLEAFNYANSHHSAQVVGLRYPNPDVYRLDDDGLTGTGNGKGSTGTMPTAWKDGRLLWGLYV